MGNPSISLWSNLFEVSILSSDNSALTSFLTIRFIDTALKARIVDETAMAANTTIAII
jgi:hypothetical protein